jgi:Zn-dependent protease
VLTSILGQGREIGEPASWILGFIALSFALGKWYNILNPDFYSSPYFVSILLAFILHEMAHKYVGRAYGMITEFTANTTGLLITFLTGFIPGIVIIAPGYVKSILYTYTPNAKKGFLYSVAAGPITNLILGYMSLAILTVSQAGNHWVLQLLAYNVWVNGWIAFLNLLPVPPLDGSKVMRNSLGMWLLLIIASIILLFIGGF